MFPGRARAPPSVWLISLLMRSYQNSQMQGAAVFEVTRLEMYTYPLAHNYFKVPTLTRCRMLLLLRGSEQEMQCERDSLLRVLKIQNRLALSVTKAIV